MNCQYRGLIFDRRTDGHRREYLTYFSNVFDCDYSHKVHRLINKQLVVFPTLEGNAFIVLLISALKIILVNRATIVVYWLTPHVGNVGPKALIKFIYVRMLSAIGIVFMSPIRKRYIPRRLRRFIHWYPEPQLIDLYRFRVLPGQKYIGNDCRDSPIKMVMLGVIKPSKNPNLFSKIVTECMDIHGVVVGKKQTGVNLNDNEQIIIVDRHVTETEMIDYLMAANIVFALYIKDQSSGVAGRAVQLSKPVLVWKDSILHYHLPKKACIAIDKSADVKEICRKIHQTRCNDCSNRWVLSRYLRYAKAIERVLVSSVG